MKPRRSDLLKTDASDREQATLDAVLKQEKEGTREIVPRVSVKEARQGATQLDIISERDTTRLLFISRDTTLLNQTTQSLDGYLNLADVFDEVHIVVLQPGIKTRNPVLRVAPNVWLYVVSASHWWWTPVAAIRMIESQLMFAEGFRPDLIVARDPYESAIVASYIGRHFDRHTQLHVLEDTKSGGRRPPHAFLRSLIARRTISRFQSIRTSTDQIAAELTRRYPLIPDIATLPRFHNYQSAVFGETVLTLKEKYPQFSFVIVYVGNLDRESLAYQAMDAVRGMLRNSKIGLVFCGEGVARKELLKRAELLSITEQVVFERTPEDLVSFLRDANVLVVPESTSAGDEVAILGAFARVPLVLTSTPQRSDLFLHGQSALLCAEGNVAALGSLVGQIANDVSLRRTLVDTAYEVVSSRLHEDPLEYQMAYRDSVEAALFTPEDMATDETAGTDTV